MVSSCTLEQLATYGKLIITPAVACPGCCLYRRWRNVELPGDITGITFGDASIKIFLLPVRGVNLEPPATYGKLSSLRRRRHVREVVRRGRQHVRLELPGDVAGRRVVGDHDDFPGAGTSFAHAEEARRHPDHLGEVTCDYT